MNRGYKVNTSLARSVIEHNQVDANISSNERTDHVFSRTDPNVNDNAYLYRKMKLVEHESVKNYQTSQS